ncbi:MAG: PHP domain-containing protein, partial [Chloroflexi bacterium]|nr:PHP domain-containing protein [Chloroflexota bacterium]
AAGLDALCVTEHDWFWDPDRLRHFSRLHKFPLIPAVEVNTDEGHMLAFGLERYVFGMHKPQFLRQLVDEAGGALIACHPYRRILKAEDETLEPALERASTLQTLKIADAVESFNGRGSERQNAFAQRVARLLGLPPVADSDAHDPAEVARAATRFEREVTSVEGLVQEIKAGRFSPVVLNGTRAQP